MPTRKEVNELRNRRERLLLELVLKQGQVTFKEALELLHRETGQVSSRAVNYRLHDLAEKELLGYDKRNRRYVPGRLLSSSKPNQEPYEVGEVDTRVRLSSNLATAYTLLSRAWLILSKVPYSRRDRRVVDWLEDARRRRLVARKLLGRVNEEWLAEEFGGVDPYDSAREAAAKPPLPSEIRTTEEFVSKMASQLSEAVSDCDRLMREVGSLPEGTIKAFLSETHAFADSLVKYVSALGRELSLEAYRWNPEGLVTMRVKNTGREEVSISGLRCDGRTKIAHAWYNGIAPGNSAIIQFDYASPEGTEHEVRVNGDFAEYRFSLEAGHMDEIQFGDIEATETKRRNSRPQELPKNMKLIGKL